MSKIGGKFVDMATAVNLCIEQCLHLTELYVSTVGLYVYTKNFKARFCTFDSLNSSVFVFYSMA